MSRPTIADVAKFAGVSKATVSRVLSGNYEYMRPKTKAQVEDAIEKLNYRPSSVARSLTSNRTNTAAILVSDVGNPFYADVIRGAEDGALKRQYDIFLCNTNYDLARGLSSLRSLIDKRVDGVLLMSSSMSELWLEELRRSNVPAVVLDWELKSHDINTINIDYATGIEQAVAHLVAQGHQQLAHVSGPLALRTARERRDAFLQSAARHGLDAANIPVIEGNLQIDGGRTAIERILALPQRPTAVFAANDLTAMGVIAGARAAGVGVPDELSVIGLDNIWLAEQIDPPLTTVALPRYEIGRIATQLLFEQIDHPDSKPVRRVVETTLIIRKSSGTAP